MRRATLSCLTSLLILLSGGALPLWSQQAQASITGTLTDTSGASVSGATVTAVEQNTAFTRTSKTSVDGSYTIPLLPPGTYKLTAEKPGFDKSVRGPITLAVDQQAKIDIEMKVGSQTTTITVESGAPLLETQNYSVGTTIEQAKVSQLPFNGRHFLETMLFTPGVVPGSEGSELNSNRGGSINVNGMRETMNTFLLDGMSNTSISVGTYVVTPPLDSIQEFKMETGVYDARFGTNAGAVVNVVTKSGSNQLHGTLYEYLRNNKLDARNFFEPEVPPFHRNQFGASLGGPLSFPQVYDGHDRTFFFLNYEGLRDNHSFFSRAHVPTPNELGGDFSDIGAGSSCSKATALLDPLVLFNPGLPLAVPGNNVAAFANFIATATGGQGPFPLGTVDPVGQALGGLYPSPNIANAPCGGENYTAQVLRKIDTNTYVGRFDHRWGSKDSIFYRYTLTTDSEFSPSGLPTGLPGFGTKRADWFTQTGLDWSHVFSPTLINEAKIGYNRWQYRWNTQDQGRLISQQLGLKGAPTAYRDTGVPNLSFAGYDGMGSDTSFPQAGAVNTFEYADTLTQVHGNHSLAYGVEVRSIKRGNFFEDIRARDQYDFNGAITGDLVLAGIAQFATTPNPNQAAYAGLLNQVIGQYYRNSQGIPCVPSLLGGAPDCRSIVNLGNGLADAMFGIPSDWIRGSSGYISGTGSEYGYFAQDTWKARRNLTLTMGLRYEYNSLVTDKYDHFGGFDFNSRVCKNPAGQLYQGAIMVSGTSSAGLDCFAGVISAASGLPVGQFVASGSTVNLGGSSENRALQRPDRNNFGPRIGFAWQPGSSTKTVIRGGYGLYYDQMVGELYFQKSFNPPFFGLLAGNVQDNEFPVLSALGTAPSQGGLLLGTGLFLQNLFTAPQLAGNLFPTLNPVIVDVNDGLVHQWTLDVQHEFPGSWLLDVAYVGTRGLRLPFEWDPNQPNNSFFSPANPGICIPACPRPYGPYLGMSYTDSVGKSVYHALQVKAERHYTRGLAVIAAYTYSKSLDTNSTYFGTNGTSNFPENSYNLAAEKGRSDFDYRHRFSLAYIYDLPFGNTVAKLQNSRVNYLIQGWQLSGIAMVQSGAPYTPTVEHNPSHNVDGNDRPNVVPGVSFYPAHQTWRQWANPAAFSQPGDYTFGNAGRDILTGPGEAVWDFSLIRKFKLTESKTLEFRAEMFNIFNQANFTLPNGDASCSCFGVIGNTVQPIAGQASGGPGDPREIQFALRFTF